MDVLAVLTLFYSFISVPGWFFFFHPFNPALPEGTCWVRRSRVDSNKLLVCGWQMLATLTSQIDRTLSGEDSFSARPLSLRNPHHRGQPLPRFSVGGCRYGQIICAYEIIVFENPECAPSMTYQCASSFSSFMTASDVAKERL